VADDSVHLRQRVRASVESTWRAWTDPTYLCAWQADEASGEVRTGGRLLLGWPALGVSLALEVVELVERERIVFAGGPWRLEVQIARGEVSLTHGGLSAGDDADGVRSSWRLSLAILAHYLENHFARRRRVTWMVARARTTHEAAHVFFTDGAALGTWLGASNAGIGETGSAYALELGSGDRMSGTVLANTGRDVLVQWDEDGGSTLAMRTLPTGEGERLLALSWSRWSPDASKDRGQQHLAAAVERLAARLDRAASA
jgi:hypothetical protein